VTRLIVGRSCNVEPTAIWVVNSNWVEARSALRVRPDADLHGLKPEVRVRLGADIQTFGTSVSSCRNLTLGVVPRDRLLE
jgi:hypothetical protein